MGKEKIVVLGAGLAGLSTAYFLSKKGFELTVLEKEGFVGGLAATVKKKGCFLDFGPHPFYTEKKEILDFAKGLVGEKNFAVFERDCLFFFNNRYISYPPSFKNALLQMGLKTTVLAPLSYLKAWVARIARKKKHENFEEWSRASFGDYLFNIFFKPYTEKFWGLPCKKLDASWADARISKMSFVKTLFSLFRKKKKIESLLDRDTLTIYYPKRGIGELANELASAAEKHGAKILLKQKISSIKRKRGGFEIVSNGKKFFSKKIVSSIPVYELVPLIAGPKPQGLTTALAHLKKRSLIIGYFVTKKRNILKSAYIYFLGRPYHRITETEKFSKQLCPKRKNMLSFEVSCFEGDAFWDMPKKKLAKLCISALEKDGFLKESEVEDFFLLKARDAYSVYSIDYKKSLSIVLSFLEKISGLCLVGRQGKYNYEDMDQVIAEGKEIAASIANP